MLRLTERPRSLGPVGGFVGQGPPGFVATAYNLMTPSRTRTPATARLGRTSHTHRTPFALQSSVSTHIGSPVASQRHCAPQRPLPYTTRNVLVRARCKRQMTQNVLKILRSDPTVALISVSNMDGDVVLAMSLDMAAAETESATGAATSTSCATLPSLLRVPKDQD